MNRIALHHVRRLIFALLLLAPAACDLPSLEDITGIPSRSPDVLGVVTVKPSAVAGFAFEVDVIPPQTPGPMFAIKVDASTRFLKQGASGTGTPATLADVTPGAGVSVWLKGAITEGSPSQGTADLVVIAAAGSN
jgi:hypothetical protein